MLLYNNNKFQNFIISNIYICINLSTTLVYDSSPSHGISPAVSSGALTAGSEVVIIHYGILKCCF